MRAIASGCVSTRTSLFPFSSWVWSANRAPRKSASSSPSGCTMVAMAPSSSKMRSASAASSAARTSAAVVGGDDFVIGASRKQTGKANGPAAGGGTPLPFPTRSAGRTAPDSSAAGYFVNSPQVSIWEP